MKTLDEMIAVMQAARDGKLIERRSWNANSLTGWYPAAEPTWDWGLWDYRVKPEPRKVPLGPEDVPPGSLIRWSDSHEMSWCSVLRVDVPGKRIYIGGRSEYDTPESLFVDAASISRDGGQTWQPCWKEAQS